MPEKPFPEEIFKFFEGPGGKSLLLKGAPGTGKTTFALQFLEEMGAEGNGIYLSTRVGDESLYRQFPWLKEKERRSMILDASKVLLSVLAEGVLAEELLEEESEKLERAREFLRTISPDEMPEKTDRRYLKNMMRKRRMPEVERVYDEIDKILPNKPILVVDSVEGITHKFNLPMEDFIFMLQKDLVENSATNLILVLEKSEFEEVEYIVDGVVSMHRSEIEGRSVREIHLEKLRGVEIKYPRYLMTLRNGRFLSIRPKEMEEISTTKWKGKKNKGEYYSTGIPELDYILGGGFRKGTYNVIELGEDVPNSDYWAFMRPIFLNFIMNKMGILAVLTGGEHVERIREDISRFIDVEMFDRYVRVTDYFASDVSKPYIIPLGVRDREEAVMRWRKAVNEIRDGGKKPIVQFTGFDTLEYLRGGEIAIRDLFTAVGEIKTSDDVGIGILKPGLKISREIINMADIHLKLVNIDKIPCLYGVKPRTIIYAILPDEEKGLPYIKLLPIV